MAKYKVNRFKYTNPKKKSGFATTLGDIEFESDASRILNTDFNNQNNINYDAIASASKGVNNLNSNDIKLNKGVNYDAIENTSGEFITKDNPSGEYEVTNSEDNMFGDFDYGSALTSILPGISGIIAKNNSNKLYDKANISFDPTNLKFGTTTDLAKPNFFSPVKVNRMASDASGFIASQKFDDISRRGEEANYELENSASRIAQRDKSDSIYNQQEQFNAQRKDMIDARNSQRATVRARDTNRFAEELFAGSFQNFFNNQRQGLAAEDAKKMMTAEILMKKGKFSEAGKILGYNIS